MAEENLHADGNEQDATEQFRLQPLADNVSEPDSKQMTDKAEDE